MNSKLSTETTIFPRFNELPTKIRHQIWSFALSNPQVIMVEMSSYTGSGIKFTEGVRPISAHSPLLHVNQESRSLATILQTPYRCPNYGLTRLLANLELDIIWPVNFAVGDWLLFLEYMDKAMDKRVKSDEDWSRLRRLVVPWKVCERVLGEYRPEGKGTLMHIMKNLSRLGVREIFMAVLDGVEERELPDSTVKLVQPSEVVLRSLSNSLRNSHFGGSMGKLDDLGQSIAERIKEIQVKALEEINWNDISAEDLQKATSGEMVDSAGWITPRFQIFVAKKVQDCEKGDYNSCAFLEE